jgi:hypothetical protein
MLCTLPTGTTCEGSKLQLDLTKLTLGPSLAIRFSDLDVDPRTRIENATLRLRALTKRSNSQGSATLELRIADHYDAQPPVATTGVTNAAEHIPTTRSFASPTVQWTLGSWESQTDVMTPNLAPLVQYAVDQALWKKGNSVLLEMRLVASSCNTPGDCSAIFASDTASSAPTLSLVSTCLRPPSLVRLSSLQEPAPARRQGWLDRGLLPVDWNETTGKCCVPAYLPIY